LGWFLYLRFKIKMISRGKILWADDEIDFLKSHVLYLEEKGYEVLAVNSGEDAFENFKTNNIDLILLDEMMTGMDGIETLKKIKNIQPDIPIIMITKNEEEWLMEKAIASQISNYLIKPVNPTQIFMACKNILEKADIRSDHISKDYLSTYQSFNNYIQDANSLLDWFSIYDRLCDWTVKFDSFDDISLNNMLHQQFQDADKIFSQFISENYKDLVSKDETRKLFTPLTIKNNIQKDLEDGQKTVLIIMDCLRGDQWKSMSQSLFSDFKIKTNYQASILPSTTFYSRNSIFSGLFPLELYNQNRKIYSKMLESESNYNKFEHELLKQQLDNMGLDKKSNNYIKVSSYEYGKTLTKNINNFKNIDLLCIVVNFIDILAHSRSESGVLKEVLTDEASYRDIIYSWIENSWFREVLNEMKNWNRRIYVTSDHGSIMAKKPIRIKAYKDVSSGVRYKMGRNIKVNDKYALRISNPTDCMLPSFHMNENYLIALDNNFFVFPNNYNQYVKKYNNTFQHGGISMSELIVPISTLDPK